MAIGRDEIDSYRTWALNQPRVTTQIIATRSTSLVFPLIADAEAYNDDRVAETTVMLSIRALAIAYGVHEVGEPRHSSAFDAGEMLDQWMGTNAPSITVHPACDALVGLAYGTASILRRKAPTKFDRSLSSPGDAAAAAMIYSGERARLLNPSAMNEAQEIGEEAGLSDVWQRVFADRLLFQDGLNPRDIIRQPLWVVRPEWFIESWANATRWLSRPEHGFEIWREWYYGRLKGLPHAFAGFDDAADRKFYEQIIERDDNWWSRDPAEVNADIKALVDSLRIPKPPSDEELTQNPRAFTFSLDAEGRSDLDEDLLPNGLQGDADERDNHSEVLRLIEGAVIATAGDTNAKDMADPTDLLKNAIGANIEELRPRLFILRARELIRQVKERESGTSMNPQLSEKQRDAYLPLVAALEMIAEFSPKLAELWNGKLGQTGTPLTRETLDLIALALRTTGQTTELAQSIVEASNRQVAPDAPEDDPARIAASETSRNLVRKMGGGIKKAGDGARAIESIAKLIERGAKIWRSVKDHLPAEETITRILEWIARGGG